MMNTVNVLNNSLYSGNDIFNNSFFYRLGRNAVVPM